MNVWMAVAGLGLMAEQPMVLLPVINGLPGAGCSYAMLDDPKGRQIFVVEVHSLGQPLEGTARIRVGAADLDLTPSSAVRVYEGSGWRVEVLKMEDFGPQCTSGECEGSFRQGKLRVRNKDRVALFKVLEHCGA